MLPVCGLINLAVKKHLNVTHVLCHSSAKSINYNTVDHEGNSGSRIIPKEATVLVLKGDVFFGLQGQGSVSNFRGVQSSVLKSNCCHLLG